VAEENSVARAVLDGSTEVIVPRMLAMFSILAVFLPSLLMKGVARSLFVPLSLTVAFAMIASYFLASSFVPVLAVWMLHSPEKENRRVDSKSLERFRDRLGIVRAAGPSNVASTLDYIGVQPTSYPVNTIFLWTSGEHEGLLRVSLKSGSSVHVEELEEQLRKTLPSKFPNLQFSFEAGDIVSQIMNFGAPTPIEVNVTGNDLSATRQFSQKVRQELSKVRNIRDLQVD